MHCSKSLVRNALGVLFFSALTAGCGGGTPEQTTLTIAISPTTATIESGKSQQFAAAVAGSTNTDVIWSVEEPEGGAITAGGVYTAAGVGTFHVVAIAKADTTVSAKATITVTPSQQSNTVVVGVSPSSGATIDQGAMQTFSATVTGASHSDVIWSVVGGSTDGEVSANGVYTAPHRAGNFAVKATSVADTTRSASASVTVRAVGIALSPQTITLDEGSVQSFAATVTGTVNVGVTWDVVGGASNGSITQTGVYTAPAAAGTYQVKVISIADPSQSATATITVNAGTAVSIAISPKTPSIQEGAVQQFAATVSGHANTAVTWSVDGIDAGTVSSTGLYTAPNTPGTYTVRATSQADATRSDTAIVTVTSTPPPVSVSLTPKNANVQIDGTQQFSATVSGHANTAVTWSVDGIDTGTVSSTGLYTAPNTPGTYTVRATSQADTTRSDTAIVTVTSTPPPVSVSLTPKTSALTTGTTQQLTVSVSNAANANVTWLVVDGSGNANPSGGSVSATSATQATYTAPSSAGTYFVRVTSVEDTARYDTAELTVTAPPPGVQVTITNKPTSVQTGAIHDFAVNVTGSTQGVSWSASHGSIDAAGHYIAPATATPGVVVTTTSLEDSTRKDTATFDVVMPPVTVGISPKSATRYTGFSVEFTSTVSGTGNLAVNYEIVDASGNPNPAGGTLTPHPTDGTRTTYTAPGLVGTYYVRAKSAGDPSKYDTATVTVSDGSYTLTGTISYSGARTGRIYLLVHDTSIDRRLLAETSIASAGSYTLSSITYEGSIEVSAYLDHLGTGMAAANSPRAAAIRVNRTSTGGNFVANLTLTTPTPVTVTSPAVSVTRGVESARVEWSDNASAENYTLYWSQTTSPGPSNNTGSRVTGKTRSAFVSGLTPGTWYFAIAAHNGMTVLAPGAQASITIGASAGPGTINGTVSLPGFSSTSSDLYLLFWSHSSESNDRIIRVDVASTSQSYSATGLINGTYTVYLMIDVNKDGSLDNRDLIATHPDDVVISSVNPTRTVDFRIKIGAFVRSFHKLDRGVTQRALFWTLQTAGRFPVSVILSGPGFSQPINLPRIWETLGAFSVGLNRFVEQLPGAGSSFTYEVIYNDGTTETITLPSPPLIGLARNLAPVGSITSGTPTFSWSAPNPPPSGTYSYKVYVVGQSLLWSPTFPSSTTSVVYNSNGTASQSTLSAGSYYWLVETADPDENMSRIYENFVVQ